MFVESQFIKKSQHPCYSTTSNDLGKREIGELEKFTKYYGLDGRFSNVFYWFTLYRHLVGTCINIMD